jgi:hypothetical protein
MHKNTFTFTYNYERWMLNPLILFNVSETIVKKNTNDWERPVTKTTYSVQPH